VFCPVSLTVGAAAYGLYKVGSWIYGAIAGGSEPQVAAVAVAQQTVTAVADCFEHVAGVVVRAVSVVRKHIVEVRMSFPPVVAETVRAREIQFVFKSFLNGPVQIRPPSLFA
jgi:hypothetical protein